MLSLSRSLSLSRTHARTSYESDWQTITCFVSSVWSAWRVKVICVIILSALFPYRMHAGMRCRTGGSVQKRENHQASTHSRVIESASPELPFPSRPLLFPGAFSSPQLSVAVPVFAALHPAHARTQHTARTYTGACVMHARLGPTAWHAYQCALGV